MHDQIMTSQQVCELLNIGRQTLRKLRNNDNFPYFMVGASLRYSMTDVLEWTRPQTPEKEGELTND